MSNAIRILLVDDESRNLDALESILEDPDYCLLRAQAAEDALRLLLDNDVAAIVLDIKMPVVTGFELAQLIKGTKKFRQIPIVFLTAHLMDDRDVLTGYDAGAVDYLTKPVNPRILRQKVAVFADLFRKTRALAELNAGLEARVQERTTELETSEAALRAANQQKDRFLATLAHELRNPLAPLRTGLDILLHQPEQTPAVARTLGVMNRQLDHMVRLVDDLLDVARINSGTLEMRKEDVELGSVIERAIETIHPAIARRRQSIRVEADRTLRAFVDPTRIAQIVGNLLSNASKHSPEGAEILVVLSREGDVAAMRVVDRGAGIPVDQISRVFEMFTKVERSVRSNNDGLGIGLALSRHLAMLHGGSLVASSAGEGKGATFTLSLPVESARVTDVGRAHADEPPTSDGPALRVVVVEDNEDSADMLSAWLEQMGHEVHVARTGPAGVSAIVETAPDVVLCDIGLPELDGVEVCRRVLRTAPVAPVMVALTGWGMESDRRRTIEAGFEHHLVKPVELDLLRDILRSAGAKANEERRSR